MRSDRRAKYLGMFRDEAREHVSAMTEALVKLEAGFDQEALDDLLRRLHTIKGSAQMIQLAGPAELAHRLEDGYKPLRDERRPPSRELVDRSFEGFELILSESSLEDPPATPSDAVKAFLAQQAEPAISAPAPAPAAPAAVLPSSSPDPDRRHDARFPSASASVGSVRVDIEKLDRLLDLAGELLIHRTRLEVRRERLGRLARSLLARSAAPDLCQEAQALGDTLEEDLVELGYLFDDIRYQTMEVRMLPVASILDEFYRTVRSLSRELRKQVRLEVEGKDTEVDKRLLETVRPMLMHIIRNSLDHGVEPPAERVAAGKPEEGVITVAIRSDGRMVTFTITDDGRGIDPEAIRVRSVERGRFTAEEAVKLTSVQLLDLIFEAGFSTAERVTEVSGRGVGMDVVKKGVEELKGTLAVDSELGRQTRITFTLPMTLSVISALLVEVSGQSYALPLPFVVETVRFSPEDIVPRGDAEALVVRGEVVPLWYLSDLLGFGSPTQRLLDRRMSAVVVRRRHERLAVGVDRVVGDQDVVVKTLGDHLKSVRFVLGATFVAEGTPALILNCFELFDAASGSGGRARRPTRAPRPAGGRILVVDDSLSTRTMERNILESEGYAVEDAVSAEDALQKLASGADFDLFLFDVDMPGLSGIELTQRVRASERTRSTPVIIVSSVKDQARIDACRLAGAEAYIAKGEFEQGALLELIARLLELKGRAPGPRIA